METVRRFANGGPRRFDAGEMIYDVGNRPVPAWLVPQGSMDVFRHDGLSHAAAITTRWLGWLSGEVNRLSGLTVADRRTF